MEQPLLKPGGGDGDWKIVFVAWVTLVGIVYATTDYGLVGTGTGMAGLYFVYRGAQAIRRAVSSRSVEREAIGTLGGHDGPVEIDGNARPADGTVTAPMTGTESVAYRVQVFQHRPTSNE